MTKDPDTYNETLRSGRRWTPGEVPPESKRAALHRLADSMRATIEALTNTDATVEELNTAAELGEQLAALITRAARRDTTWGFGEASNSGDATASFDNSPLLGPANPIAPPLQLHVEGQVVHGSATFTRQYEGPPGHVHGGIVSAAFDEVLGMVQSMTGNPGMTGRLIVHYRSPTPLYREVSFRGKVDRVEGRKIFTSGTLHAGDRLCAEAEGLFISVDFSRLRDIANL